MVPIFSTIEMAFFGYPLACLHQGKNAYKPVIRTGRKGLIS